MDKNPIERQKDQVSWRNIAKPFVSVREVNEVVVWWMTAVSLGDWKRNGHGLPQAALRPSAPRQICRERSGQKSAETIVVGETSQGLEDDREDNETGRFPALRSSESRFASLHCVRWRAPWLLPNEGPNRWGNF